MIRAISLLLTLAALSTPAAAQSTWPDRPVRLIVPFPAGSATDVVSRLVAQKLSEHLKMTRQAVAQHLGILEAANLVVTVWRGREKLHYLNPVPIDEIYHRWIRKFERKRLGALRDLKDRLEGDVDE